MVRPGDLHGEADLRVRVRRPPEQDPVLALPLVLLLREGADADAVVRDPTGRVYTAPCREISL